MDAPLTSDRHGLEMFRKLWMQVKPVTMQVFCCVVLKDPDPSWDVLCKPGDHSAYRIQGEVYVLSKERAVAILFL